MVQLTWFISDLIHVHSFNVGCMTRMVFTLPSSHWSMCFSVQSGTSFSQDPHLPLQSDFTPAEELWKILEDILTTFQPSLTSCDTLRHVLTTEGQTISQFMKYTFPATISLALRMPELFPTGVIPNLHSGVDNQVSLTREQIACILVHMFLCTIQPAKWNKFWANFSIWYSSSSRPVLAYLRTLLTYFEQLSTESGASPSPDELVTFQRCVLHQYPDWGNSKAELVQVTPSSHLEPFANVEVDFANKDIGFGVSGSQEEAKLAQSPETCVVMLLAPTLQDNEALVIRGARKVGKFTGIGRNISFIGAHPIHSDAWTSRTIIAIDSLELDEERNDGDSKPIAELSEKVLNRELNKAFCGFSSVWRSREEGGSGCPVVATGHWGCGAFGGNREAKALIQVSSAHTVLCTVLCIC